jgi:gliding motility-associated-like protein
MKQLLSVLFLIGTRFVIGQPFLLNETFETGTWQTTGDVSPNNWIISSCAGNGSTALGSNSLYITDNASSGACSGDNFGYTNSVSGINQAIVYKQINLNCFVNLSVAFDFKNGCSSDSTEFIYSTNNGVSWNKIGNKLPVSTNWTTYNTILPSGLNASTFRIGFRFYYNNQEVEGIPVAIDNFRISGTLDIVDQELIELCNTSTSLIQASQPGTGQTGTWTFVSGSGTFNNEHAFNTAVNGLAEGVNTIAWSMTSNACGTLTDTMKIILYKQPLPASIPSSVNYLCENDTIALMSNAPLYGNGLWTSSAALNITDPSNPNAIATQFAEGWTTLYWTISNGTCPSTQDSLKVYKTIRASITEGDTTLCYTDNNISLHGNVPIQSIEPIWKFISGDGSISDPNATSIDVSDLMMGTNTLVYIFEDSNCPTTSDTTNIMVSICNGYTPEIPTVFTPNLDGKNDVFDIPFLHQIYPDCKVTIFNRSGNLLYESTGYSSPWNGTNLNGEPLQIGTYFYKIELMDEDNTQYNGSISIIL